MSDPIQPRPDNSPVPVSYAEKTMASLLQLHTELMEEKERRVDLYRRLMEKEESVAELRYQVKLLEDRLRRAEGLPPAPSTPLSAVQGQPVNSAMSPVAPVGSAPAPLAGPAPVSVPPVDGAAARAPSPAPKAAAWPRPLKREDWRQW